VTWLGHSTLLIEIDETRLLTDPVWGNRVSPIPFAGPKRFHPPPAPLDALPALDAVIVSHDHYDHLDRPTILEIARTRKATPFITSLGVGERLERWGIPTRRITELGLVGARRRAGR
jgi:L-ascorbate metabolism protein UlaG (beta-lactamase superfamily)